MPRNKHAGRIKQAQIALAAYKKQGGVDPDCLVRDLMADLGHWCDKHGLDWDNEVRIARDNYRCEKNGIDDARTY